MRYPTLAEVESADREQLARWYRFLDSPGTGAIGTKNFDSSLDEQRLILDRIIERFKQMGMFTPELSKTIGWEK